MRRWTGSARFENLESSEYRITLLIPLPSVSSSFSSGVGFGALLQYVQGYRFLAIDVCYIPFFVLYGMFLSEKCYVNSTACLSRSQ